MHEDAAGIGLRQISLSGPLSVLHSHCLLIEATLYFGPLNPAMGSHQIEEVDVLLVGAGFASFTLLNR